MATSLYDMSVASYLQALDGVAAFLKRGFDHFTVNGVDPNAVVDARLADNMLPFSFQVVSVAHHSLGAIEGIRKGVFSPGGPQPAPGFSGLQKLVTDTGAALRELDPAEVNAMEGKDVAFQFGEFNMPFTAETFVMSFSLPNFYFHATTAYDILRTEGVPLGKRDFMGRPRLKV